MFVNAIDRVDPFTRPIHSILRLFGHNEIVPGSATLFFVNEQACAVTCKHVAELIAQSDAIFRHYNTFRAELRQFQRDRNYATIQKKLEEKYQFKSETVIRLRNMFMNCVDQFSELKIDLHPTQDLAILRFIGYNKLLYKSHAVFLRDSSRVRPGRTLCRLGYPFPEFTNYLYNAKTDDIEWTVGGRETTPKFPIDGIVTRLLSDNGADVTGIEMSTPGLRGQSGGPLFDTNGVVYGMQTETRHLHLGFDIEDRQVLVNGRKARVSNYPFLNVGACVHVDVIKRFLADNGVNYFEE
ncbi:S1 family peptidase [Fibrella aquatilis]|uniref:Trypsin-like peptidase domain-containing protein n=1 Tax=Fibrella aquatilis TaxID=2817059 RepID=A0A939JUB6_9BACT|nr:serine protease [Fibrella aquatilis]MBO0929617.1 trypsin-like peptidase domain-containing protein [Fibrella aquatilis]